MNTPLMITFHQLTPRPDLAAEVHRLATKLDEVHKGITHCHVVMEVPDRHHAQGRSFDVRIELGIPGGRIVVSHLHDAAGGDENPAAVIRAAFRIASRRLRAHTRRHQQPVAVL